MERHGHSRVLGIAIAFCPLLACVGLLALALLASGERISALEKACTSMPVGIPCEQGGSILEEAGGEMWNDGGMSLLMTPRTMQWGVRAFPMRRQACWLYFDMECRVEASRYTWWVEGIGEEKMERLRYRVQAIRMRVLP